MTASGQGGEYLAKLHKMMPMQMAHSKLIMRRSPGFPLRVSAMGPPMERGMSISSIQRFACMEQRLCTKVDNFG